MSEQLEPLAVPRDQESWLRTYVAVLYLQALAARYRRLLDACDGDDEAATLVFATILRAEGWREG